MLSSSRVEANIPAADLKRARDFYADVLGLTPTREIDGIQLTYRTDGGTTFNVYATSFAGQAGHTIAQWHVDDVEAEVRDLKAKGVAFEVYDDMPGVRWDGDIASMEGMGRAAWFKDSEGNTLCLDQEDAGT
jgi:predicted enzyme related to lactoylglutathione lyase